MKSLMAVWPKAYQWHETFCYDPMVKSLTLSGLFLGVHSPVEVRFEPKIPG